MLKLHTRLMTCTSLNFHHSIIALSVVWLASPLNNEHCRRVGEFCLSPPPQFALKHVVNNQHFFQTPLSLFWRVRECIDSSKCSRIMNFKHVVENKLFDGKIVTKLMRDRLALTTQIQTQSSKPLQILVQKHQVHHDSQFIQQYEASCL